MNKKTVLKRVEKKYYIFSLLIFSASPSLPFSFLTRIFANRKFQNLIQLKHYFICFSLCSPRPLCEFIKNRFSASERANWCLYSGTDL